MTGGTNSKPTVSLVISVWNRKDDLRENLAPIRAQTAAPHPARVAAHPSPDSR